MQQLYIPVGSVQQVCEFYLKCPAIEREHVYQLEFPLYPLDELDPHACCSCAHSPPRPVLHSSDIVCENICCRACSIFLVYAMPVGTVYFALQGELETILPVCSHAWMPRLHKSSHVSRKCLYPLIIGNVLELYNRNSQGMTSHSESQAK